jgi:hypothetical protein
MHDRTVSYRPGAHVPDPAREAKARLAGRRQRLLGRQALARGAHWRRCVLGAMTSGLAILVALQFGLGRPVAPPAPAGEELAAEGQPQAQPQAQPQEQPQEQAPRERSPG